MKISKNYKKIINIPNNVLIQKKNFNFIIEGPLGTNIMNLTKYDNTGKIHVKFDKKKIILCSLNKNFFKAVYTLIVNKIHGVMNGFLLYIKMSGIGYKVEMYDKQYKIPGHSKKHFSREKNKNVKQKNIFYQTLHFKIGFSHLFKYIAPLSIKFFLLQPTLICLYGIDKNKVSEIYAKIKQKKPASIYKGKGFKLLNEKIYVKTTKR